MRTRSIGSFAAALGIVVATAGSTTAQFAVTRLETDHQPLAEDFNARKGRPRLVTVWSPT